MLLSSQGPTRMGMHLYQIVGRHLPVVKKAKGSGEVLSVVNKQKIYRMKVFAEDEVRARSPGVPEIDAPPRPAPQRRRPRCRAGRALVGTCHSVGTCVRCASRARRARGRGRASPWRAGCGSCLTADPQRPDRGSPVALAASRSRPSPSSGTSSVSSSGSSARTVRLCRATR